jgi:ribosomal protein S18 acetylase RimI-like enzyme
VIAGIRPLCKDDIWTASGLLVDVFSSRELNPWQQALMRLEHVAGLSQRCGQTAIFVATAGGSPGHPDGTMVGFVEVFTAQYLASMQPIGTPVHIVQRVKPYIASLAVQEGARGRGIGEALVQACEEAAVALGQRSVQIQVEAGNEVALRLYARLGYRVVSIDTRATKLVGDILFGRSVGITKLTLEKRLAPVDELSELSPKGSE